MRKKLLAGVIGAVCMLGAMQAHAGSAGQKEERELKVEVNVPDETFWVDFDGMNWPDKIRMDYDRVSQTFHPWERKLRIFNNESTLKVQAKFQQETKVSLPDGSEDIPLTVKIGSQTIDHTTPKDVHASGSSASRQDFTIQPVKASPAQGKYEGTFILIFELVTA